ncbi:hypothetical protein [Bradyrhizobium mercantei]|uniref:hypothetical protein n=1 Tax=Bradyrhizobium mercantei TaxID=1904807 RepID=UPI0013563B32|nr:hypothetical protein [Bradyrhizobium mercantei]
MVLFEKFGQHPSLNRQAERYASVVDHQWRMANEGQELVTIVEQGGRADQPVYPSR